MTFELKISVKDDQRYLASEVKQIMIDFLEAIGRTDYVEGYIDGVSDELSALEIATATTTEERMSTAPVVLFDDRRDTLVNLAEVMKNQFADCLSFTISEISDESWQSCWNSDFVPLQTQNFFIVPLGNGVATPVGLERVEIDAGNGAFGTGQHATTRAVIKVLENGIKDWQPSSVLDVGTGTGIYLILAGKMGLSKLVGTEISDDLVSLANSNCQMCGVDATVLRSEDIRLEFQFDLIIANILVPVLHDLMPQMASHLKPNGVLVLAGFVQKEEGALLLLAARYGLDLEMTAQETGWRVLVLRKKLMNS
jgi:ribosomal protein L11 methyltransferase